MKERALSRAEGPWSSQAVDEIAVSVNLHEEILMWIPSGTARACGYACGYAADFEITRAMEPFFKEIYEGEIRRQMRILRRLRLVDTVDKQEHAHRNPDTNRWQQCHRLPAPKAPPPRKRVVPRVPARRRTIPRSA
jgi:hypothetical protein